MNILDLAEIAKRIKRETKYTALITLALQCLSDGVEYNLTFSLFDTATNALYGQGYAHKLQSLNFAGLNDAVVDMRQCGESKGAPVCKDVLTYVRWIISASERKAMG
jgi:hypothetical protein